VSILSFCLCIAWEIEGKREVIPAKVRVSWSCEDVYLGAAKTSILELRRRLSLMFFLEQKEIMEVLGRHFWIYKVT
jgi:hypothetical protein